MNLGRYLIAIAFTGMAVTWLYFYYDQIEARRAQAVSGLGEIMINNESVALQTYQGVEHPEHPLRLRGCFQVASMANAPWGAQMLDDAVPFGAIDGLDCYDPEAIDTDLQAGQAKAYLAGIETFSDGRVITQRIVVLYPDGKGYQWRRLIEQ
ncbi:MAG: DUF6446 family protein [Neomegalonema sp.]|nr:DUF6446 family protein [Neomegalonema sp.]